MPGDFDGSGDGVDVGTFDVGTTDELTIMCWIYLRDIGSQNDPRQYCKGDGTGNNDQIWLLSLKDPSGDMKAGVRTSGSSVMPRSNASLNDDEWAHIAMIYDGSNVNLYINGSFDKSSSESGNIDTDNSLTVKIGRHPTSSSRDTDGILHDVRHYERALSVEELETIYYANGKDHIVNGLKHHWNMWEGAPGTSMSGSGSIKDVGEDPQDGTPEGNPTFAEQDIPI